MSGRRKSDQWQFRAMMLAVAFAFCSSLLASFIGYRALKALNNFIEAMDSIRRPKSLIPDSF